MKKTSMTDMELSNISAGKGRAFIPDNTDGILGDKKKAARPFPIYEDLQTISSPDQPKVAPRPY